METVILAPSYCKIYRNVEVPSIKRINVFGTAKSCLPPVNHFCPIFCFQASFAFDKLVFYALKQNCFLSYCSLFYGVDYKNMKS